MKPSGGKKSGFRTKKHRKGKSKRKSSKSEHAAPVGTEDDKIPRSFVFKRGNIGRTATQLVQDMRHVMRPFTAVRLQESRKNALRDFVHVAGPLGVTHFVVFSMAESGLIMRLMKTPHGPTLTFKVNTYTHIRDVVRVTKNPISLKEHYKHAPLVVLNNFTDKENHIRLMAVMFQNLFPTINIQTMKLSNCKRVLLLNYDSETKTVEFRHYAIKVTGVGVSKAIRSITRSSIPSLSSMKDIGDFILGGDNVSDSEAEDVGDNKVEMQSKRGKGGAERSLSAIKLKEIGPRMQLELLKIEEGLSDGEVMYHAFVHKTPDEVHQLRVLSEKRRKEKEQRKSIQAQNVRRKAMAEEASKQGGNRNENRRGGDSDDDAEYYRQEVGEEPDADFIKSAGAEPEKRVKFNPLYRKRKEKKAPEEAPPKQSSKSDGKKGFKTPTSSDDTPRLTTPSNPVQFVRPHLKRKPMGIALHSAHKKPRPSSSKAS